MSFFFWRNSSDEFNPWINIVKVILVKVSFGLRPTKRRMSNWAGTKRLGSCSETQLKVNWRCQLMKTKPWPSWAGQVNSWTVNHPHAQVDRSLKGQLITRARTQRRPRICADATCWQLNMLALAQSQPQLTALHFFGWAGENGSGYKKASSRRSPFQTSTAAVAAATTKRVVKSQSKRKFLTSNETIRKEKRRSKEKEQEITLHSNSITVALNRSAAGELCLFEHRVINSNRVSRNFERFNEAAWSLWISLF